MVVDEDIVVVSTKEPIKIINTPAMISRVNLFFFIIMIFGF